MTYKGKLAAKSIYVYTYFKTANNRNKLTFFQGDLHKEYYF